MVDLGLKATVGSDLWAQGLDLLQSGCSAQGRPQSALNKVGYGLGLKGCGRLWLSWGSRLWSALTYGLKAKVCFCYSLAAGLKAKVGYSIAARLKLRCGLCQMGERLK